jgi:hypothetical protein
MVFIFNLLFGLVLMAFQTAVLPRLPFMVNCYDLLLPYIIYITIFRPLKESCVLVVGMGLLIEQLSGVPFGLFTIVYLWVMVGVRWGVRFFNLGNFFLMPFIVAAAVIFENTFFVFSIIIKNSFVALPIISGKMIFDQFLFALISAPLLMVILNSAHRLCAAWGIFPHLDNGKSSV